jgi:uncharacterized protein (TIGR03643 family)
MIDTNELIEMAWSDDVTFSDIERDLGIKEPEVKRIMKANLKSSSYKLWRKRVRWIKEKKRNLKRFKR